MSDRKTMWKAEELVSSTSAIGAALLGQIVECDTYNCPEPAAVVEVFWDGPGPYWFAWGRCLSCHHESQREAVVERDQPDR